MNTVALIDSPESWFEQIKELRWVIGVPIRVTRVKRSVGASIYARSRRSGIGHSGLIGAEVNMT